MEKEISQKKMKQLAEADFIKKFFEQKLNKYFSGAKSIKKVKIESIKGFLNLRNLKLKYNLLIDFEKYQKTKIIQARARKRTKCIYDNPQQHYLFLNFLWNNGFKKSIPRPLDYFPEYNLLLYENVPGIHFQKFLEKKKIKIILQSLPQIAQWFKKLHQTKIQKNLPIKDKNLEVYDHQHWLFLLKETCPQGIKKTKSIINLLNKLEKKYSGFIGQKKDYLICHGDSHLGNFIKTNNSIKVVDFAEARIYDPLDDIARFIVQSESMLNFYLGEGSKKIWPKFYRIFIETYFGREKINLEQSIKLKFFEIRNLIQMSSNLIFFEKKQEYKKDIFKNFSLVVDKKIKELKILEKKYAQRKIY